MNIQNLKAIFIEAGHGLGPTGRPDPGAVANGTTERKEVVQIAKEAAMFIERQAALSHVAVFLIGVDRDMTLLHKIQEINRICADRGYNPHNSLLVSVHINAASAMQASGIEAWYYGHDTDSRSFGEVLAKSVATKTSIGYRFVKSEYENRHGQLGIVHNTTPLACLLECGFLTNLGDAAKLKDEHLDDSFAHGIIEGILSFTGAQVQKPEVSSWAREAVDREVKAGTATKWDSPQEIVGSPTLEAWFFKKGLLEKNTEKGISKERMALIFQRKGI